MRHIILGTAGHIDHGKSTLVHALTGVDPDRLKEEKERGITIDIGFADLVFPESGVSVGIVDVPGHERLIRNMLAGAGGIDMVLLVIAADEGIMPQSREHLAICNLLRIKSGLIAVTKSDLVESEWLELIQDEIRDFVKGTFLEGAPVIPVSSRTGYQIDLLKETIQKIALSATPKISGGLFRLPIDRVFTLKGFGTVITGTALSGSIGVDDPIEILPAGVSSKVRGLHSHGRSIQKADAGQRVAVNLQGVEKEDLRRGDVAVEPNCFSVTRTINAHIELLEAVPDLKTRSLVHFYSGTTEVIARVILFEKEILRASEDCYCQFRIQEPVIAVAGDRFIIRRFSPLETLGGGLVLDPSPAKRRKKDGIDDLKILHTGSLEDKISVKVQQSGIRGIHIKSIFGWTGSDKTTISNSIKKITTSGIVLRHEETLIHQSSYLLLQDRVLSILADFHRKNPIKPGLQKEEVRTLLGIEPSLFSFLLVNSDRIIVDRNLIRLTDFKVTLTTNEAEYSSRIIALLNANRFQPPLKEEMMAQLGISQKNINDILTLLMREGKVVKINESIFLSSETFGLLIDALKKFFTGRNEITVAEFRDLLNTSRKYALPFLEHLDTVKVTLRVGDARKLMLKG